MRIHELHAPVKIVGRAQGRSATAAAAYRSGTRIEDERTGLVHDFTRKKGIEADALFLPDNAPEFAYDRAKLWNAAELREKHPRAQTARDMTVSFPSEFNAAQRREAGMKIGQFLVSRFGVAVDIAWHEPSKKGDQRNHHMHALFTTRKFDENGAWAKTKDRTLDDLKKGPEEIAALRLGVADALNNIAARDRLDVYVEHLSFEKRGLDHEPTQHVGPIATNWERAGVVTDIGTKNRETKARNEQRRILEEERKVIDIQIARERMQAAERQKDERRKAAAAQAEKDAQADAHAVFYKEAQERRAALLTGLDRQHGEREKQLRQEIASLADALDNAGFFKKAWRNVTGRARQDREKMQTASRALDQIHRERQAAHENFERDRQLRLEALKVAAQQQREAQQEPEAQPLARAVGDVPAASARSQEAQTRPATEQTAPSPAPAGEYEARRRAYFQRLGAQRKAAQDREQRRSQAGRPEVPPTKAFEEARKPATPEPAKDFDEAAGGGTEHATHGASPEQRALAATDYEARRAAYLKRLEKQRERNRDRGPTREL